MSIHRALLIVAIGLVCSNPTVAQELRVDVAAVKRLVTKWNEAHSLAKVQNFSSLYSRTVDFYGSQTDRSKCVLAKRQMMEKHKDFGQAIKKDLVLSGYSSGMIRCDFVKTVTRGKKTIDYGGYLIIKETAGDYFIVGEGDLISDRNIKHKTALGSKVTIRDGKPDLEMAADVSQLAFGDLLMVVGSLAIGVIGLAMVFRWQKSTNTSAIERKTKGSKSSDRKFGTINIKVGWTGKVAVDRDEDYETGLAFEKYVVEQFGRHKGLFTLLEWRSDKFHEGIFAKSSQYPDLVYEYKLKNYVQRFSVECKYRSRLFNNSVRLMDDTKYRIYEAYHLQEMPVYIVLGVGGTPDKPVAIYLIPLKQTKLEMTVQELSPFRMTGEFFYDMHTDRLTWYVAERFA